MAYRFSEGCGSREAPESFKGLRARGEVSPCPSSVNGLVLNEAGTGNAVALDAGRLSLLNDRMESLGSTRPSRSHSAD